MNPNRPFSIGFVGCGSYGRSLANAAGKSPKLRLTACYDIDGERAASFVEKHAMEVCASMEDLLAREDVEGVVIATPNNAHRENVEAAAAAGKHVFVDKPIANTLKDGFAIIDAAEKAGVTLAVGHNGRRLGGHRKLRQMIDDGAVGMPVSVEANFSHSAGLNLNAQQWRASRDECPGLPLMQLGVHFADTVQYLLGDVVEVSSFMSRIATPVDNDDITATLLKFENGLLGYLGSNYASPSVYYVNVYGTGGNLYCDGGARVRYQRAGDKGFQKIPVDRIHTQIEELEEFADCALSRTPPEVDGSAALKALAVVRAALRSSAEGHCVRVTDLIFEARCGSVSTAGAVEASPNLLNPGLL